MSHGPTNDVNFKKKINKAAARASLAAVLSARVADGKFLVAESLAVPTGKTKDAVKLFAGLAAGFKEYTKGDRILAILPGTAEDMPIRRATQNLPDVGTIRAQDLNTLTVLSFPYVIASADAVAVMEKTFK